MASHFAFTDLRIPLLDAADLSRRLQDHERACVAAGQSRIRGNFLNRARRILERLHARSGTAHLRPEEIRQLAPLARGVRLAHLPDVDAADRIAAELHAEMPWMAPASRIVWQAIRLAARTGTPIRVPPLLLVGPPGIGKSAWARRLADQCPRRGCRIMGRCTAKTVLLGATTPQIEPNPRTCQMPRPLSNSRHEAFAQAMAAGMTPMQPMPRQVTSRAAHICLTLAANGSVAARITALKAQAAARTVEKIAHTDADFISRLTREADYHGDGSSHRARVQAVNLIGDHLGLLKQRIEHGPMDGFPKAIAEISRRGSALPVALPTAKE